MLKMPKLFMIQLGGRPKGRLIEQHDMFFGVAEHISELIPAINEHWPEVKNKWHIDSYREVTKVGDYQISWADTLGSNSPSSNLLSSSAPSNVAEDNNQDLKLFFVNLGGYLPNDFEEYHHKLLIVAPTQADAIKQAKQSEFYKKFTFKDKDTPFNAASHVDDKRQVDVDEIYQVDSLLPSGHLVITPIDNTDLTGEQRCEDKVFVGYLSIKSLNKWREDGF